MTQYEPMHDLTLLRQRLDALLQEKSQVLLAIDGPCASGKSTLAQYLAQCYDCNLLHVDDFFLRPQQRTPQRFAEPGGNVDYERFLREVLLPLRSGGAFAFRPFDCATFTLAQPVSVLPKQLTIIEGSYSHHPYFGDVYDLRVFLTVEPQLQRQRILQRPAFLHDRFFREWIPMEQRYFDHFQIPTKADLIL